MTNVSEETNPPSIRRLTDNELARVVSAGFRTEPAQAGPDAKERNVQFAQDELGHIATLRQNAAFQWFSATCIERGFKQSRETLEEVDLAQLSPRATARLLSVFQTWRVIARWLDEREIEHRRLLNPKDPELEMIRARLDLH